MIGKLQGIVDYIGDGFIILMTGGVGYKVFTPEYLTPKSTVTLWIETIVREDSIRLFGFSTIAAQNLFNQLTAVSGVGDNGRDKHGYPDDGDCNGRRKNNHGRTRRREKGRGKNHRRIKIKNWRHNIEPGRC